MKIGRLEIDLMAEVARLARDTREAKGILQGFAREANDTVRQVKQAFAGVGAGLVLRELVQLTDQYTKYTAQLRLAVRTEQEYQTARAEARRISQSAATDLAATGVLYARISNATRELGKTQADVSKITEAVALSLRVSGATQQEAASATLQLSQAFGAGALRGEEFNAVNEAAPRLMKALADGMGVPIGAMRELAKEGKITAAVMAEALPLALIRLQQEAGQIETISGHMTNLKNTVLELVGAEAEAAGFTKMLGLAIAGATKDSELMRTVIWGLIEGVRAAVVLFGNVAFVLRAIGIEVGGIAAQAVAFATGDFKRAAEISREMKADAEANRKAFDEWEKAILETGAAAKSTAKNLGELDQVERRMFADGQARVRAVMAEGEAKVKAAKDAEKARKELARTEERLRKEDIRGWVEYIEAKEKEDIDALKAEAKRHDQRFKDEERLRKEDIKSWVAHIDAMEKEDIEALKRAAALHKSQAELRAERDLAMWQQASDAAGTFFYDVITLGGKTAFDNLRRYVKQVLAEMVALFAKRWVLNMAGQGSLSTTGGGGGTSGIGSDLMGTGLSMAGDYVATAAGFTGMGTIGTFVGAASGAIPAAAIGAEAVAAGVGVNTFAATAGSAMSGVYTALAAIPVWGWIAMAVIAIGAWIAGNKAGGPKVGGSFFSGGAVPGTDNGRFFTPNQGDPQMQQLVEATSAGYEQAVVRLGGTAGKFGFGLGFDHDPNGDARSRVSSMLTGADGQVIYSAMDREMDDKEVEGALGLESQRMVIAALQNSDLEDELDALFDKVGDVSALTGEQIQAILAAAMELKGVIDVLALWDNGITVQSLREMAREGETLAQTLQAVAQAQQSYYQMFYSEEENRARLTAQLNHEFEAMGHVMPATRAEFRAMVEAALDGTEAGSQFYRWLLQIAGAMNEVLPPLQEVVEAVEDVGTTVAAATELIAASLNQNVRPFESTFNDYYAGKPARQSLADNLRGSLTGQHSPLDPMQQLSAAEREFYRLVAAAKAGDLTALGQVGGARDTVLGIGGSIYGGSTSQFAELFNRTFDAAAPLAEIPAINEQMLTAANKTAALTETAANILQKISDDSREGYAAITAAVGRVERAVATASAERR